MILALLALVLFAALLIFAACTDVASLTIPNWIPLAMAGAYLVFAVASGVEGSTLGVHLAFGLGVLAVGFFLFQANIIGGGDAKLLAATAIWCGSAAFVDFITWTAIAGGVLALVLLVARNYAVVIATAPAFVFRLLTPKSGLPYGVAIMIGGLMAAPSMPLFSAALTLP